MAHGRSVNGVIEATDRILQMSSAETSFIAGHGPLMKRADVQAYRYMLVLVRNRVAALINEGKSEKEIVAAKPTADIDAHWQGGIPAEMFVKFVCDSLTKN